MKIKHILIIVTLIVSYNLSHSQIIYKESFETGLGTWVQLTTPTYDQFDWTRMTGPTPSPGTGPNVASDSSYYLYIEATGNNNPAKSAIIENTFNFSSMTIPIFYFDYHMYGRGIGTLSVTINDGSGWTEIWNQFTNLGNQWYTAKLCLGNYAGSSNVKIRFTATTAYSDSSDIAIDNIILNNFYVVDTISSDVTCGGYSDGSITISVGGGFPPYKYSIDDGVTYQTSSDTTYTFDNLPGSDYPIRIMDASGCMIQEGVIDIFEPETPSISTSKVDVQPCVNSHNGELTIYAMGDNAPYRYSVTGSSGPFVVSNTFTSLDTGYYQTAVIDINGCIATGPRVRMNSTTEIKILDIEVNNITNCYNDCNGSLDIVVANGNAPYTYHLGSLVSDNSYFSNLCAGTYRYIIVDNLGCRDTSDYVTITQPSQLQVTNVVSTNITGCFGDSTGTINITATGGTGSLLYSVTNGNIYQGSGSFLNLPAKTYNIKVRDANSCIALGGPVIITQPPQLIIDSIITKNVIGCFGNSNGEIHFYAHGGTDSIFYSVNNGATYSTNPDFTTLTIGTYYPKIRDKNFCTATDESITLTQPSQLQVINVTKYDVNTCYGGNNGIINIFCNLGTPPYQYSVDSGITFQSNYYFSNLTAGTYRIAARDTNGCIDYWENPIIINQPTIIKITDSAKTNVSCYGLNDGTIRINATGGTGSKFYSIDNGLNFQYAVGFTANVKAGTYIIKVRDNKNCVINGPTYIVTQPDSLRIDSIIVNNVNGCYGDSTGSITFYARGGSSPLKYSIDNGSSFQLSNVFSNLPARTGYLPFLKDNNQCFVIDNPITIGQPSDIIVTGQSHTNIDTCNGVNVGTITVTSAGGTGTRLYSIDNGANYYNNNGLFTNLYAGVYNIKVKDAKNCIANGWQENITQPPVMYIDSIFYSNVVCSGQGNGKIYIFAMGGQPQLKYSVDGGLSYTPSNQFSNLGPGNYHIVVKDNYDCKINDTVVLTEPSILVLDSINYTDVSTCFADNSGTLTVTAHGGVPQIMYMWSKIGGGSSGYVASNYFNDLYAGSYFVTIKDQNGCIKTSQSFTIQEPPAVVLSSYEAYNISCNGLNDGRIIMHAAGGNGVYQYSIDNGTTWQTDSIFSNLYAGNYTLKLKDSNECIATYSIIVTIYEPTQLSIYNMQGVNPTCFGYTNGRINVYVTGGTGPYTYILNDTLMQSNNTFNFLSAGTYWVTVIDSKNCVVHSDTLTLEMPPNLSIFSVNQDLGCSPFVVQFSPNYTYPMYYWTFGDGGTSYIDFPTHTFFNNSGELKSFVVAVVAEYGNCIDSSLDTIYVYSQPNVYFEVDTSIHFYPDTNVYLTNIFTEFQNYHWDFGDGQTFDGLQPEYHSYPNCGTFTINLSAENELGCSDTNTVSILMTAVVPNAGLISETDEGCQPLNAIFNNTSSNAITYRWIIDGTYVGNDTILNYTFEEAINHKVLIEAIGFCDFKDSAYTFVNVFPVPNADFTVPHDTIAVEDSVRFVNLTDDAFYFIWNFGDSTYSGEVSPFHKYANPGHYNVLLKAYTANGCIDSVLIEDAVFVSDEFRFALPNAFSPDGDGINDLFIPVSNLVDECTIEIYNRRGQLIFKTKDYDTEFWDGSKGGKQQPMDVYIWRAYGKYKSGHYFHLSGDVTIIR